MRHVPSRWRLYAAGGSLEQAPGPAGWLAGAPARSFGRRADPDWSAACRGSHIVIDAEGERAHRGLQSSSTVIQRLVARERSPIQLRTLGRRAWPIQRDLDPSVLQVAL
jgi:hypothetical protein